VLVELLTDVLPDACDAALRWRERISTCAMADAPDALCTAIPDHLLERLEGADGQPWVALREALLAALGGRGPADAVREGCLDASARSERRG
jgi:hypothetical protein